VLSQGDRAMLKLKIIQFFGLHG